MAQTLTVAVCFCDGVTLSDFIPPMEILSTVEILSAVNTVGSPMIQVDENDVKYRFAIDYVAPTKEPVHPLGKGLITVNPTKTYSEVISKGFQYDILWIPAGPLPEDLTALISAIPKEQIDFIRTQAPGAKYVVSVCAGSFQLAAAGVLDGKRATTNKSMFKLIASQTSDKIQWVPKARWVVDGNIWTSSGVSAGGDMALAFLEHLNGAKIAQFTRGIIEIPQVSSSEDDPFAAYHGLI